MPTYTYTPKINGLEYEPGATIGVDGDTARFSVASNVKVEGISLNSGKWIQASQSNGEAFLDLPLGKYWDVLYKHAGGKSGGLTCFTLVKRAVVVPPTETIQAIGPVTTPGTIIADKTIQTAYWGNNAKIGINPIADDVTIRNVNFTGDGGFLIKVNGKRCLVDGVNATTFNAYAMFAEGARDLIIRRMKVIGGSRNPNGGQAESIIRFADCEDVLVEDSVFDYRPVPPAYRKATCRGNIVGGVFNRCEFYGAVVGNTCMTGFDGGEGYLAGGMLRIMREPWIVTLTNAAEWEAAVKKIIAEGVTDQADILNEAMRRVTMLISDGILSPSHVDVAKTVSERAKRVNQRSDVTYNDCLFDSPVRNSAGTAKSFNRCKFVGDVFTGWNEAVYPSPRFRLPGDIMRPATATSMVECAIETTTWTKQTFENFCVSWDIKLNACKFNGEALADRL